MVVCSLAAFNKLAELAEQEFRTKGRYFQAKHSIRIYKLYYDNILADPPGPFLPSDPDRLLQDVSAYILFSQ